MYIVKKNILKIFRRFGYQLAKIKPGNGPELDVLYYIVSHLLKENRDGYLVQIGANDGITNDPVRNIIMDFKVPSILIEPQPAIFKILARNYEDVSNVECVNAAIDEESSTKKLFYIDPSVDYYPKWAIGIASFNKETLLKHKRVLKDLENNVRSAEVPTVRFDQLLKDRNVSKVFILQVDTEGYDFIILKHVFSCNFTPSIIQYEHKHLSAKDQYQCRELLSRKNYSFISSDFDTIAVLNAIRK